MSRVSSSSILLSSHIQEDLTVMQEKKDWTKTQEIWVLDLAISLNIYHFVINLSESQYFFL